MNPEILSSRAIEGRFFRLLEIAQAESWLPRVAATFQSDQPSEKYPFLSSAPVMREWIGGRMVKGFEARGFEIINRHFEGTVEFKTTEIQRDKTKQIDIRIGELAQRAALHPERLVTDLLLSGETSLCYDGQYFFDTDHAEGLSGTQSNIVTVDITTTGVPLAQQGTTTAPSAWTLACAIRSAVMHLFTLKDDQAEPFHVPAKLFLVMLPGNFLSASQELKRQRFTFDDLNPLWGLPYQFEIVINNRLTWSSSFTVTRIDGDVMPIVWQIETGVKPKMKGAGSEHEFDTAQQAFGVDQWCAAGYGYWQYAILCKLQ